MTFNRRRFLGTAAMTIVAAQLGIIGYANEQSSEESQGAALSEETNTADAPLTVVLVHGAFADALG
jgi:nitrous oxide reductase